jgi:hypothetical protein
VNHLEADIV